MENLAIIQARLGSSRLPNKVLMKLGEQTILESVLDRVKKSKLVDEVIVATTINRNDIPIVRLCSEKGIRVCCGSETDVLDRYYQVAKLLRPTNIIRITADCPLLDAAVLEQVIQKHIEEDADYTALGATYPDGLDCEIMRFAVLEEAWKKAVLASDREHVTQYIIHNNIYSKQIVENDKDYGTERWTVDTAEDYMLVTKIYESLGSESEDFTKIIRFLNKNPELRCLNSMYTRNEGLQKSLENDYILEIN